MDERAKRLVVMTGATGGIGQAICARLVRDGFHVLATDRDASRLEELRARHGNALSILCQDLTDLDVGTRVLKLAQEIALPVVGFVHAAAISAGDEIEKTTDVAWHEAMDVNVGSAMRIMRELTPLLRKAEAASVVLVSSPVAFVGARKVGYAASKAALQGLKSALAAKLGKDGIRVNAILPGPTITRMTEDWPEEKRARIAKSSPFGRLSTPEETANVISFLLGPDSTALTGTTVDATGGRHIGE